MKKKEETNTGRLTEVFRILNLMQIEEAGVSYWNVESEENYLFKVKHNKKNYILLPVDNFINFLFLYDLDLVEYCYVENSTYHCLIKGNYRHLTKSEFFSKSMIVGLYNLAVNLEEFDNFIEMKSLQNNDFIYLMREFFIKYEIFKQFLIVSFAGNYERYLFDIDNNRVISYNHIIAI